MQRMYEDSVHLSLFQTVSLVDRVQGRMHRYIPQSAVSTGWIRSRRSTSSCKMRPKALDISSLEFYPLLCSSIYLSVAVHVSHNGCRRSKNQTVICQQTDHLSLSTNIICCCQQTVQLLPVPKPIQLKQTISPKMALTRPTNVSKEIIYPTMYFVLCIVCCVVYCLLCCANNQMHNFSTKFHFFS